LPLYYKYQDKRVSGSKITSIIANNTKNTYSQSNSIYYIYNLMNKLVQFQMGMDSVEVREAELVIKGYASTPTIDRYNSIVEVDGIRNGLENYKENPVLLLGHDSTKPIGTVSDWSIDEKGRLVEAVVNRNIDGVMDDINEGRTKGFSIGFIPLSRHYIDRVSGRKLSDMTEQEQDAVDYKNIVRVIDKVDIVELSVVNVPANPQSLFTISKALRAFFAEMETRDVAKRLLISDENNPFIDHVVEEEVVDEVNEEEKEEENEEKNEEKKQNDEKTAENEEQNANNKDKQDEVVSEQGGEEESVSDEGKNDATDENGEEEEKADEESDIVADDAQDDEGSDGENPDAPQDGEAQADVEEATDEEQEAGQRSVDTVIDELLARVESLQSQLNQRAVNKPVVYTRQTEQKDPFADMLRKAKGL
jgi:phage head maturation protease